MDSGTITQYFTEDRELNGTTYIDGDRINSSICRSELDTKELFAILGYKFFFRSC